MKTINFHEAQKIDNKIFVDVRSPKEYQEDHIYGAINIPLLDNEERAIIGTLYKHEGKEQAVEKGYEYVLPKLEELHQKLKMLTENYQEVTIYCFRGGMRSSSVVDFAQSKGLKVSKLENGYKGYRNYVLEYLKNIDEKFKFVVLHGNTCVGKTDILLELEKVGLQILDLEFLAKNSGSVFGGIYYEGEGPSQKYFETLLFEKFISYERSGAPYVFMESESKKIGRCYLSKEFWSMMQNAHHILVEATIEERVQRSVHDYSLKESDNDRALVRSVRKLKDSIGKQIMLELEKDIQEKDYAKVAKYLMENYYDQLYRHSEKKYSYELTVNSGNMPATVNKILNWHQGGHNKEMIGEKYEYTE